MTCALKTFLTASMEEVAISEDDDDNINHGQNTHTQIHMNNTHELQKCS